MGGRVAGLGALLREAMESRLADVHVAFPAKVVTYDATAQTVDVQPSIQHVVVDPRDGTVLEPGLCVLPQINAVPVVHMRAGGYFIDFPLAPGDHVLIVFCERSIDRWWSEGLEGVDPSNDTKHDFAGAVAIPGLYPSTAPLSGTSSTEARIGKEGGMVATFKTSGELHLGTATEYVALATSTKAQLDAIVTQINTFIAIYTAHVHSAGVGPTVGPPAAPGVPLSAVGPITASKVKAQ